MDISETSSAKESIEQEQRGHSRSVSDQQRPALREIAVPRQISETTMESDEDSKKSVSQRPHNHEKKRFMAISTDSLLKSVAIGNIFTGRAKQKQAEVKSNDGSKSGDIDSLKLDHSQSQPTLSGIRPSGSFTSADGISILEENTDAFAGLSKALLTVPKTKQIVVGVKWRNHTYKCQVFIFYTIKEALQDIIHLIHEASPTTPTPKQDPHLLKDAGSCMLGKIDRKMAGMRIWLHSESTLYDYDIEQGDELLLKHITDIDSLQVAVPPQPGTATYNFGYDMLVCDLIATLKQKHAMDQPNVGLYYPSFGMWLDETKTLLSYNFEQGHVELRAMANQIVVRIYLAEFDQTIAIRVLPNQTGGDVRNMVFFQLQKRSLHIKKPNAVYGLRMPSLREWVRHDVPMSEYTNKYQDSFHFVIQYQNCTIKMCKNSTMIMPVDETATIKDTIDTLEMTHHDLADLKCRIYSPLNEPYPMQEKMWNILDQLTEQDFMYFAPPFQPITIQCGTQISQVDIDFYQTLGHYLSFFCRKLGLREHTFQRITKLNNQESLPMDRSIISIPLQPYVDLQLHVGPNAPAPVDISGICNIWDEKKSVSTEQNLGTFNHLVERFTADSQQEGASSHLEFVKTFLCTYPSFTTSLELIEKLNQRYAVPNLANVSQQEFEKYKIAIQLRVCNALLLWTKKYPAAFIHPEFGQSTCDAALKFVDHVLSRDHIGISKQIRKNVVQFRKISDQANHQKPPFFKNDFTRVPDQTNQRALSFTPQEIAEQLTIIEVFYFSKILPSELLGQAWMSKNNDKTAPNILNLTNRFNAVAWWVAQCILDPKTPKLRAERMSKLVEVAQALLTLKNYSTLMAIIAGMNRACISRLHQTFKELPSKIHKKKQELEKIMSAESSYKNYRQSLHSVTPPCIPYIGTYLTDLTYMEDGNPNHIDNLINFTKREMIGHVIREVMEYQQLPYQLPRMEELGTILCNLEPASKDLDKRLWNLSKQRE
ncbi:ras guanine nucleotide exchange factor domain-containing protein [Gorgonomyces haynaldii]|nr:ras guanine nucleotide exchange factor domain-containing protein [Gorgonomyces haynaldii]